MKKIGILTFTDTLNFGAELQAYALQEVIKNFGEEARLLQYTNEEIKNKENNSGAKKFSKRGLLKSLVMKHGLKKKRMAFKAYEQENIAAGMTLTRETVPEINRAYDMFITGSDQVWNMKITNEDWNFFLEFVEDNNKKVSYAPSFGNSEFPKADYEKAGELLSKFKALSVRENSGRELIKKLCGRDAEVVLDPTLLLKKEEWEKKISFVPDLEHYILVYFPHKKKPVFDFVKKLKKQTGFPVVYLSISPRIQPGVRTIYDSSPDEFLGWIKNADYVVTGSFHGTAFSINFEKKFFYEPSGNGSRIDNLVTMLDLKDRSIETDEFLESDIDYTVTAEKLNEFRNKSLEWLKNVLND